MGCYKDLKVWQLNQNCILGSLKLLKVFENDYARLHIAKQLFRAITTMINGSTINTVKELEIKNFEVLKMLKGLRKSIEEKRN